MKKIIIFGCGGHAKSSIEIIEKEAIYSIAGIISKDKYIKNKNILNYKIIGIDSEIKKLREKYENAFIGIGQIKDYKIRLKLFNILKKNNFNLPNIFSPNAYVSKRIDIGMGNIIMHNVIINADVSIGNNCIVNNKSLIEHDVKIENNCHISTNVVINGQSIINKNTFIGSGTTIINNITIGENCIIGAGKTITKNVKKNSIIK